MSNRFYAWLIVVALLGIVSGKAWGQQPNLNFQTGIGVPELQSDSVPGAVNPAANPGIDAQTQALMAVIDQQARARADLDAARRKMRLLQQSQNGMNHWDALVMMSASTNNCIAEAAKDKRWYTRISTIKSACGGTQDAYVMAVCTQVVMDTGDSRDLGHCTNLYASMAAGDREMAMSAIKWAGRIVMTGVLGHYAAPIISDWMTYSQDRWNSALGAASKQPTIVEVPQFVPQAPLEVIE